MREILITWWKKSDDDSLMQDYVFQSFMAGQLAVKLPKAVNRRLLRFGLVEKMRLLVILLVIFGVGLGVAYKNAAKDLPGFKNLEGLTPPEVTKTEPAFNPAQQAPLNGKGKEPPQKTITVNAPTMMAIKGGCFLMGSSETEPERSEDEKQHKVCVTGFEMGKYEVTRGQFNDFVTGTDYKTEAETGDGCYGWTGSTWEKDKKYNWRNLGFEQTDKHPVACVSWNDAQAYIKWLNTQTGKTYRLPTEAEWEYAARAGTTTPFYTGNCINTNQANYNGNYDYNNCGAKTGVYKKQTVAVGSYPANKFGLYDMAGNVWEWTCSDYVDNYDGSEKDCYDNNNPKSLRVVRGGSWASTRTGCVRLTATPTTHPTSVTAT